MEFVAEQGDVIANMLAERIRNILADQREFALARVRKAPLCQGDTRPKEAVLGPAKGDDMIVIIGGGKGEELARHAGHTGNFGDVRDNRLGHRPAEGLGDAAAPYGEIGAALLEGLLHILVDTARQAIKRDEAAYGNGDAEHGENRAGGPALKIAEGELQVVHVASSSAGTDCWLMTFPSFILICRLQRRARSGA